MSLPTCCFKTPQCSAEVLISMRSRSAGASKCGASDPTQPGKYFLSVTYDYESPPDSPAHSGCVDNECHGTPCPTRCLSESFSRSYSYTKTYDKSEPGCPYEWSGSGDEEASHSSESCSVTEDGTRWYSESWHYHWTWTVDADGSITYAGTGSTIFIQRVTNGLPGSPCLTPGSVPHTSETDIERPADTGPGDPGTSGATATYSSEYTTAALIGDVQDKLSSAAWSAWSESSTGGTVASRNLSESGVSCSFSESEYKVKISNITASFCQARLTWNEWFYPAGGGERTLVAARELEWSKTGRCSPLDGYEKESEVFTPSPPDDNGHVEIGDFKLTCEGVPDNE